MLIVVAPPKSQRPLGTLANKELREFRIKAHAHIAMFNEEQCKKVLELKLNMEHIH